MFGLARSQDFYYKPLYVDPFDSSYNQIRPVRSNPTPSPPPKTYPTAPPSYEPSYGPAKYEFDWNVLDTYSGNDYGHKESRDDKTTVGSYHVALPDGRIQTVTYSVDGYGGYQAEVSYEGSASYPEAKPYKPAYPPPPKSYPTHPVQPYSSASVARPAYAPRPSPSPKPEAKAAEVKPKPQPIQKTQKHAPVTAAPTIRR